MLLIDFGSVRFLSKNNVKERIAGKIDEIFHGNIKKLLMIFSAYIEFEQFLTISCLSSADGGCIRSFYTICSFRLNILILLFSFLHIYLL
jgi:hypothetical protein